MGQRSSLGNYKERGMGKRRREEKNFTKAGKMRRAHEGQGLYGPSQKIQLKGREGCVNG